MNKKYGKLSRNVKTHFCRKCLIEMLRVKEKESYCSISDKMGHDIIYRCPECGYETKIFEEDNNMPYNQELNKKAKAI